jgi:hypothetical protein
MCVLILRLTKAFSHSEDPTTPYLQVSYTVVYKTSLDSRSQIKTSLCFQNVTENEVRISAA